MTATSEPDDSFHVFDTTLRDGAQREVCLLYTSPSPRD